MPVNSNPSFAARCRRWLTRPAAIGIGLGTIGVVTRLLARACHLEGWDGADFALALREFDVAKQQPHFPGYPVYVAAARLLAPFAGTGPADALTLPGALAAGAATWAVWRLGGWGAALLYLAAPGLWLLGGKPLSDGLGLALLLFTFALARSRPATSGALAGLVLGVRLSYAPALLGWMWMSRGSWRRSLAGLAIGLGAWIVPLLADAGGPVRLLRVGQGFVAGHFGRWGGALGYLGPLERARRQLWGLGDWMLGTIGAGDLGATRLLTTAALALALVVALARHRESRIALLFALPYLVWALLGQNPDRPRHLAPVAAALVLAAGPARRWCVLAAAGMAITAWPLVRIQATLPSADTALVLHVAREHPRARVYAWDTARLFAVYGPGIDARRAMSLHDLARRERAMGDREILFTSDLQGKRRARYCFERLASFRSDPHVFPPRRGLTLLRYCGGIPRQSAAKMRVGPASSVVDALKRFAI